MAMINLPGEDTFQTVCLLLTAVMLVWNTVEVGRNDAANLVNAVFGSRVMRRRPAVFLAGGAVVLGAVMSSDVIETARKGIFDPTRLPSAKVDSTGFSPSEDAAGLTSAKEVTAASLPRASAGQEAIKAALAIYAAVYIVNTVLLYSYSAFGMPVSTTACLVFSLLGGALAVGPGAVQWDQASRVLGGIVCSIFLSGVAAFLIQRAARGAIRDRTAHLATLLLHGGAVGGAMAAGLCYFLLLKGMKNVSWVKAFNEWLHRFDETGIGSVVVMFVLWGVFAILIHALLVIYRKRAARLLFPVLAVLGMLAMGFAFGQNDLANCASPGLATYYLIDAQSVDIGSKVAISRWLLLGCGLLLFAGMNTKNAERVTKAEVATGSMGDHVELWAPQWCVNLARVILRFRGKAPALAPRAGFTEAGKTKHYDTLRACVITSVSASVIATASSLGLPVSTTYVAFAAVVATGMADRIFQRGDAALKLGRSIWVVGSWLISALLAAVCTALAAFSILHLEVLAIALCLALNFSVRHLIKKRSDRLQRRVEEEAYERAHPEAFALEQEDA